jgi:2-C-methyl-D-erythritol 4-phosphate cytidylyltransferase
MAAARWGAIVVAAGRGTRFGRPKQLVDVGGRPLVGWAVALFDAIAAFEALVVTSEAEWLTEIEAVAHRYAPRLRASVVAGGETRQASVALGLDELARIAPRCESVAVHDGARPLAEVADVMKAMAHVRAGHAALLGAPVVDTIKLVAASTNGVARVRETLERETLWAAQTPQLATVADLRAAHESARGAGVIVTDDAALLERSGVEVTIVKSRGSNMKVTHPGDEERAAAILASRAGQP